MEVALAKALDYSEKVVSATSYKLQRYQAYGAEPVAASTVVHADFYLPTKTVYNLSRSHICGTMSKTAVANSLIKFNNGMPVIFKNIVLQSSKGQRLCEIQNCAQFYKVVWPACTRLADYLNNTSFSDNTTIPNAPALPNSNALVSPGCFFHPHRCAGRVVGLVVASGAAAVTAGTISMDADGIFRKGAFNFIADDCKTFAIDTDKEIGISYCRGNSGGAAVAANIAFQIPLSLFYESILAMDKDIYFPDQLKLTFDIAGYGEWGYSHAQAADHKGDTCALVDGTIPDSVTDWEGTLSGGYTSFAGGATLDAGNFRLWLAVQESPFVNAALQKQCEESGIRLTIPYVTCTKSTLAGSATNSPSIQVNRGMGKRLLRIWNVAVSSVDETGASVAMNYNGSGYRWTTIRTKFNDRYLQDYPLTMTAAEPWLFLKNKLDDSTVLNCKAYNRNCFWLDDFTGLQSIDFQKYLQDESGQDLGAGPTNYIVEISTVGAGSGAGGYLYTFVVVQRDLFISPAEIRVD